MDTLPQAVELIEELADDLDLITEGTFVELVERHTQLTRVKEAVRTMMNGLEQSMIDSMPEDTMIASGFVVKREEVPRTSWKSKDSSAAMRADIGHQVATKLSTDVMTGDVDVMRRNLIENAINEVWEVVPAPSTMKAEGRRRFGLKVSDYRDTTTGYKVTVSTAPEAQQ